MNRTVLSGYHQLKMRHFNFLSHLFGRLYKESGYLPAISGDLPAFLIITQHGLHLPNHVIVRLRHPAISQLAHYIYIYTHVQLTSMTEVQV